VSAPPLPRPRTVEHGEPPPAVRMVQMLAGFQVSEALYAVAKLGVATSLTDGPRSVGELARTLGAHETALRRLLRDLTGFGLFTSVPPDSYALTPLGATLAAGQPGSVRDLALTWMETHYAPFGDLLTTVRTGEPAASRFYGQPFFDWLSADPEQVARFTGAMADLTDGIKAGAVAGYRVPGGPVVVDVGGADGALLQTVLAADPDPARRGVVLDLPHVVPAAHARLAGSPLAGRIDVVGGDFFAAVPAGDTYLLSMVLHDWDDDAALRLLRTVAAAARPGARLVALELVLPEDDRPHLSRAIDLTMLGMLGGRERTTAEFDSLLGTAGFRLDQVVGTPTPISIVEATLTG
jgi:O-methyltransferase domain/Dimerisation domain